ncbi:ankyrin repeat-containing protein, putative [Eimeria praecox]|uniref:Ankyrin repeat-containing protein, putative n=1 Tax=Eimeria praecox TaxID=51316 RepID=U6G8B6_9EIME|nr:ankyrin repeat-containing protein, putative [Eimeria praecox]
MKQPQQQQRSCSASKTRKEPSEEAGEQQVLWDAFFSVCSKTDEAAAAAAKELLCKQNAQGLNCMQLAAAAGNATLEQQLRSWAEIAEEETEKPAGPSQATEEGGGQQAEPNTEGGNTQDGQDTANLQKPAETDAVDAAAAPQGTEGEETGNQPKEMGQEAANEQQADAVTKEEDKPPQGVKEEENQHGAAAAPQGTEGEETGNQPKEMEQEAANEQQADAVTKEEDKPPQGVKEEENQHATEPVEGENIDKSNAFNEANELNEADVLQKTELQQEGAGAEAPGTEHEAEMAASQKASVPELVLAREAGRDTNVETSPHRKTVAETKQRAEDISPKTEHHQDSPTSSASTSARDDPVANAIRALTEELHEQTQLAAALDKEIVSAQEQLDEAEEANAKVSTRLASILSSQTRQENLMRSGSQVHFSAAISQDGEDLQNTITREGYEDALMQASKLEKQLESMKQTLNKLLEQNEEQERTQTAKVMECRKAFGEFVLQVAKNAVMQKGGKPVSEQQVMKLLQQEEEQQQTIDRLRADLLKTQYEMELKIELHKSKGHWQADECDSVQAMDFEQLKMENQTLNEKLVERQEEAVKLQNIARKSAQLITHWRENLAFQEKRNAAAAAQLAELDEQLAKQREIAAQLKRERTEYKTQNEKVKCQTDIANSELLTADWQATEAKLKETAVEAATAAETAMQMGLIALVILLTLKLFIGIKVANRRILLCMHLENTKEAYKIQPL